MIKKLKGDNEPLPAFYGYQRILMAGLGAFLTIFILHFFSFSFEKILISASFGASCVLVFGFPDAPFSQPRNVFFGHFISAVIGLFFYHFISDAWWSMAMALSMALMGMMFFRVVHPPGGSLLLAVFIYKMEWQILLFPVITGVLTLLFFALIFNNLIRKEKYPKYW